MNQLDEIKARHAARIEAIEKRGTSDSNINVFYEVAVVADMEFLLKLVDEMQGAMRYVTGIIPHTVPVPIMVIDKMREFVGREEGER